MTTQSDSKYDRDTVFADGKGTKLYYEVYREDQNYGGFGECVGTFSSVKVAKEAIEATFAGHGDIKWSPYVTHGFTGETRTHDDIKVAECLGIKLQIVPVDVCTRAFKMIKLD